MKFRPVNDWVLVKMDPLETHAGAIIIPDTALGQDHRKATVVSAGPEATGLTEGDRVVFNRAHGEHLQGKRLVRELGDDQLLLKVDDILFAFEGDLAVS